MSDELDSLNAKREAGSGTPGFLSLPFKYKQFRRIWIASLFSNFGLLIQGVGASWSMTQLTGNAAKVALVQTALMLPVTALSVLSGALADMVDRRKLAITAVFVSCFGASSLTLLAALGVLSPSNILILCFVAGSGMALFGPTWQASVSEQVPYDALPPAVALNGISFNLARSLGPAIGGVIVALGGAVAAFGANVLFCLPMLFVLFAWKRTVEPPRLPSEKLGRAMITGFRYAVNSPSVRVVLMRALLPAFAGGSLVALMPLIAHNILHGGAELYGLLLGSFGLGAVTGAFLLVPARKRLANEKIVATASLAMAGAIAMAAFSRIPALTCVSVFLAGTSWTLMVTLFNIIIQLSVSRWVTGRSTAIYQGTVAGGLGLGGALWGRAAATWGLENALLFSGLVLSLSTLAGFLRKVPDVAVASSNEVPAASEPMVSLALTDRSGPVVIEIDYRVSAANARQFYRLMQEIQAARQRNGAYGWALSRDIAEPESWVERFHCPTWLDYRRQRDRATEAERKLERSAVALQMNGHRLRIRRLLERPFGSVRWRDESPDPVALPDPAQTL